MQLGSSKNCTSSLNILNPICELEEEPDGKERMLSPCSPQGQGLLWAHPRLCLSLLPSPALCRARPMQEEALPAEGTADRIIAPSQLKHSPKLR